MSTKIGALPRMAYAWRKGTFTEGKCPDCTVGSLD